MHVKIEARNCAMHLIAFFVFVICCAAHAEVCRFGSQPHCFFPCRCASGQCNRDTGDCIGAPSGCAHGLPDGFNWGGDACQIGNVAYGKTANQTGVLGMHLADRALDGQLYDYTELNKYCAYPYNFHGRTVKAAEWEVDLGADHVIYNVTVFNTHDAYYTRMANFSLYIRNDHGHELACASYHGMVGPGKSLTLSCSGTGRFVKFKRDSGEDIYRVIICEVAILGFLAIDCSRCPAASTCSQVTGCAACEGAQLPDCMTDCDWGAYGTNCRLTCGHCADNATCDPFDGACPRGCAHGYKGRSCQEWSGMVDTREPTTVTTSAPPRGPSDLSVKDIIIPWVLFGVALLLAVILAIVLIMECRRNRPSSGTIRRRLSDSMETNSIGSVRGAVSMGNNGAVSLPFKI